MDMPWMTLGTLIGVSATVAIASINQKTINQRELLREEIRARETAYGEFIDECARLLVDAFQHSLEKPETSLDWLCSAQSNSTVRIAPRAGRGRTSARSHHRPVLLHQSLAAGTLSARAFGTHGSIEGVWRGLSSGAPVATGRAGNQTSAAALARVL